MSLDKSGSNWMLNEKKVDADEVLAYARQLEFENQELRSRSDTRRGGPRWLVYLIAILALVGGVFLVWNFWTPIWNFLDGLQLTVAWALVLLAGIMLIRFLVRKYRASNRPPANSSASRGRLNAYGKTPKQESTGSDQTKKAGSTRQRLRSSIGIDRPEEKS